MTNLFEAAGIANETLRPLADRIRPNNIDDVIGQDHLLSEGGALRRIFNSDWHGNIILWGPPGTGKTTIARLFAEKVEFHFEQLSAIFSGVQDLKKVFETARMRKADGHSTLLFVDEIHRFNRSQQDSFLPYMEDGTIFLIGATTENPSFELNSALLSRATVLTLNRLDEEALEKLLLRAEEIEQRKLALSNNARIALLKMADGDGRSLLNLVESLFEFIPEESQQISIEQLTDLVQKRFPNYDKNKDGHYNLISALHKSVRGSDPDAALYWLARMLNGGEDPLYIARRLIRMAVEDIGLADPQAIVQTNAAMEAYNFLGSPEGELALAQATVYLATAPKSNALYTAFKGSMSFAKKKGSLNPPKIILNAPTELMKDEGYGEGYIYDHDTEGAFSGQNYFPDEIGRQQFYTPEERGFEREINKRLLYWQSLRDNKKAASK